MYIKPCFFISTCWSLDSQGQKWLNPQGVLYIFSGIKCNWLMGIHKYNHFQYVALYLLIIAFIWKHSISLYLSYFKFNMFTFYFFLRFFFVWCGPFLKSLLNLLQYCFCFMFLVFGHKANVKFENHIPSAARQHKALHCSGKLWSDKLTSAMANKLQKK